MSEVNYNQECYNVISSEYNQVKKKPKKRFKKRKSWMNANKNKKPNRPKFKRDDKVTYKGRSAIVDGFYVGQTGVEYFIIAGNKLLTAKEFELK